VNKQALATALIVALLITALTASILGLAQANPSPSIYRHFQGIVQPKPDTVPPEISISYPLNGSIHTGYVYIKSDYVGSVELALDVGPPTGPTVSTRPFNGPDLIEVYYTTSWNENETFIVYSDRQYINSWLSSDPTTFLESTISEFSGNVTVKDVPHGWQNITVYAEYTGRYYPYDDPNTDARFYITGSSSVRFFMDAAPPKLTVLSPLNQQYATPDIPLETCVNQPPSTIKLEYSLDGAEKVAIQGNMTLTGLSPGTHNIKVYATDTGGRTAASETIVFTVSEPSQSLALITAALASVAAVGVLSGILLYSKRHKQKRNPSQAS